MIMKSLFYIIICTAALAFNSCECFSDSVKTEVTSFSTNEDVQFIANHECYGFKYALAKNQADCSWFSFKVDVDSGKNLTLNTENILVTSSMGDTIPFDIRVNKKFLIDKAPSAIQMCDTTEVGLTFSYLHALEDRRVTITVNHFPEQPDYTVFWFDIPSSKIELGRKKKKQ